MGMCYRFSFYGYKWIHTFKAAFRRDDDRMYAFICLNIKISRGTFTPLKSRIQGWPANKSSLRVIHIDVLKT